MTNNLNEANKIHVLLVEDELAHTEIIRRSFQKSDNVTMSVANSLKDARNFLADTHPDILIMDLNLPDGQGTELLPENKNDLDYPVILMTCNGSEQVAVEAMKAGVMDYIVKSSESLGNIPEMAHHVLEEWAHITEHKWEEEELRLTNEQLRICEQAVREREGRLEAIFQGSSLGIILADISGHTIETNLALQNMLGYSKSQLRNMMFVDIAHIEERQKFQTIFENLLVGKNDPCQIETKLIDNTGNALDVKLSSSLVRQSNGKGTHVLFIIEKINKPQKTIQDTSKIVSDKNRVAHIVSSVKNEISKTTANASAAPSWKDPTKEQFKFGEIAHEKKNTAMRFDKRNNRRQDTRHYYDNMPVLWRGQGEKSWRWAQLHDISMTGLGLIAPYGQQPEIGHEIEIISQDTKQQIFCKVIRSEAWHQENVFVGIRIETHIYHEATLEPPPKVLIEHQITEGQNNKIRHMEKDSIPTIDTRENQLSCPGYAT